MFSSGTGIESLYHHWFSGIKDDGAEGLRMPGRQKTLGIRSGFLSFEERQEIFSRRAVRLGAGADILWVKGRLGARRAGWRRMG